MIDKQTRRVICTKQAAGKTHDLQVFRKTGFQIAAHIGLLGDSGYQGLAAEHANAQTPVKKPKGGELTDEQRRANRELSGERIAVENVIRHIKIFRIVSERYRNRRRRFGLRFNLIAGLYNYELNH